MSEPEQNKRFGLTSAEFDNLVQAIRYGIMIVLAVVVTFLIVTTIAGLIGYQPPEPPEATPETSLIVPLQMLLASGL